MRNIESMNFGVVVARNDKLVFERDLGASPDLGELDIPVYVYDGAKNIAEAYNAGISYFANKDVLVFAHQDVYLPKGWFRKVAERIKNLEDNGVEWGVLGCFGVMKDSSFGGQVWSSGLQRELSFPFNIDDEVQSLDELLIVLNCKAGLHFDNQLPGFHLYGTDIVQQSLDAGRFAGLVDAPVIHNSKPVVRLDKSFESGLDFLIRKWESKLPVRTAVCYIDPTKADLTRVRRILLKYRVKRFFMSRIIPVDPREKSIELCYE